MTTTFIQGQVAALTGEKRRNYHIHKPQKSLSCARLPRLECKAKTGEEVNYTVDTSETLCCVVPWSSSYGSFITILNFNMLVSLTSLASWQLIFFNWRWSSYSDMGLLTYGKGAMKCWPQFPGNVPPVAGFPNPYRSVGFGSRLGIEWRSSFASSLGFLHKKSCMLSYRTDLSPFEGWLFMCFFSFISWKSSNRRQL